MSSPAVVMVGDDPASQLYVHAKATQTVEVGMAILNGVADPAVRSCKRLGEGERRDRQTLPEIEAMRRRPLHARIERERVA